MKRDQYTVTLYTKAPADKVAKLRTLQIMAFDREDAQQKAIDQCEASGVIHGNIVSINLRQAKRG